MKNYTKQITAFAVLSLFAYSANAQIASVNGDTGPNVILTSLDITGIGGNTIAFNENAVATATGTNATNIGNNTTAIGNNTTAIGNNTTAIGTNTTNIGTNTTNIGNNTTAIGNNTTAIGNNTTAIGNNTTAIGTNATNIGTNDTDIAQNTTNINDEVNARTELIRVETVVLDELGFFLPEGEVGDFTLIDGTGNVGGEVDSDGVLIIGEGVAILSEFTSISGIAAIIDTEFVAIDSDVQIDGNLEVQAFENTTIGEVVTTDPDGGAPTSLSEDQEGTGGTVKLLTTLIDDNAASQTSSTGGGFSADTDGNVELESATSATTSVSYSRSVTQEVAQAGNSNPTGVAIAGTEEYIIVNANFEQIGTEGFATLADLNTYIEGLTPEDLLALDDTIGQIVDNPSEGGNLQVGGDANVDGVLSLGGGSSEDDGIWAPVNNVAAAIGDNAQGVADNAQAVTDLAEGAVTANTAKVGVTDASVAATAAVTANTAKVGYTDAAVDDRIAGALDDTGVSENGIVGVIEKQTTGEFAGSIKLGGNSFFFNDTTDTIATTSGDLTLDADVNITGDLNIAGLTGDVASRINSNSSRIASNKEDIEQNTRGIAMVAALQHTTVLPGMNNAFDLSAAHFEGETGLALNFARRINENVQINFGAASTTDFDESVIKAGIGVQW